MICIEITGAVDLAGTLRTFYVSTDSFVTTPDDTPANTAFSARIVDPGSFGVVAFSDGKTGGATQLQTGEVILVNNDGAFDAWKDYSFDGRPIVIRMGDAESGYPGSMQTLFSGTIESIDASWSQVVIRIKDKQLVFDVPILTNFYGGTNSLPSGVDGSTDIAGQPKPRTYGKVFNVSPPCINTSLLIYQVNDGAVTDIPATYDRGASLTKGANYATNALLQAASVSASTYVTCFAEGMLRLGSAPAGAVTSDVTQGTTSADRTVAQILKTIALLAGVDPAHINAVDVFALDALNSSVVGVYVDGPDTYLDVMDQLANSVGAYFGFDAQGVLRMGVLDVPTGGAALSLSVRNVLSGIERRVVVGAEQPLWALDVNYAKNYTVQGSDIAGSVSSAQRAFLVDPFRTARASDNTPRVQFLLATTSSIDTLLTVQADAAAEGTRQLGMFSKRRDIFDVPVPLDAIMGASLRMLDVVFLTLDRFGMSGGKLFRLIGIQYTLARSTAILSLWG